MITAVDTNVLLDVFTANPDFGTRSRAALLRCQDEGALVVCDVVLAELTEAFGTEDAVTAALRTASAKPSPRSGPARPGAPTAPAADHDPG